MTRGPGPGLHPGSFLRRYGDIHSKSYGPISVSDENSKPDSSVTLSSNGECEYSD